MVCRTRPTPGEAARLVEIELAAYGHERTPWKVEDFVELGTRETVAIFADPELQRGLVIVQCAADEAEILSIAVVPSAQRQGLGQSLLNAAHAFARTAGAEELFLEVAKDNLAALHLYTGSDYRQAGVRRGYYARPGRPRVDAMLMRRKL